MNNLDWSAWVEKHSTTFSFTEKMLPMLVAWREVFDLLGYTADELNEATLWLAAYRPPRFPSEHLSAIQARVTEQRSQRYRANREAEEWPSCHLCAGSGWVVVPRITSIIDGRWTQFGASLTMPTGAVACSCRAGVSIRQHGIETSSKYPGWRPPMTLEDYERRVPQWAQLIRDESTRRQSMLRAHDASMRVEGRKPSKDVEELSEVLIRIAKRWGVKI